MDTPHPAHQVPTADNIARIFADTRHEERDPLPGPIFLAFQLSQESNGTLRAVAVYRPIDFPWAIVANFVHSNLTSPALVKKAVTQIIDRMRGQHQDATIETLLHTNINTSMAGSVQDALSDKRTNLTCMSTQGAVTTERAYAILACALERHEILLTDTFFGKGNALNRDMNAISTKPAPEPIINMSFTMEQIKRCIPPTITVETPEQGFPILVPRSAAVLCDALLHASNILRC